jgi:hypothetical protein
LRNHLLKHNDDATAGTRLGTLRSDLLTCTTMAVNLSHHLATLTGQQDNQTALSSVAVTVLAVTSTLQIRGQRRRHRCVERHITPLSLALITTSEWL